MSNFKRVISSSYSSNLTTRPTHFKAGGNLNSDISEHLIPTPKHHLIGDSSSGQKPRSMPKYGNGGKAFNYTSRQTIEMGAGFVGLSSVKNEPQMSAQFNLGFRFQNQILNEEIGSNSANQSRSPKLRTHHLIKNELPHIQANFPNSQLQQDLTINDELNDDARLSPFKQDANRSFILMSDSFKKHDFPKPGNAAEMKLLLENPPIKYQIINHPEFTSNIISSVGSSVIIMEGSQQPPPQTKNPSYLLRNQRLKLLESVRKKNSKQFDSVGGGVFLQSQISMYSKNTALATGSSQQPKHTQQTKKLISESFDYQGIQSSAQRSQEFMTQTQTYRQPDKNTTNIVEGESSKDSLSIIVNDQTNRQHQIKKGFYDSFLPNTIHMRRGVTENLQETESIPQAKMTQITIVTQNNHNKMLNAGTQTGAGDYLQSLASQKLTIMKKQVDSIVKQVDQREMELLQDMNVKLSTQCQANDKVFQFTNQQQLYSQGLSSLVEAVFDEQILPAKMCQILKKQMKSYLSGLKDSFQQMNLYFQESMQRQAQQFSSYKSTTKRMDIQLEQAQQELSNLRESNYEEFLKLDSGNALRRTFELLGNLSSILHSENHNQIHTLIDAKAPLSSFDTQRGQHPNINDSKLRDSMNDNLSKTESGVENPEQMAQDVIDQFDRIDRIQDPFERKMKKTQILMNMQASNVTLALKEIHNILLVSKNNNLASALGQSSGLQALEIIVKEGEQSQKFIEEVEVEFNQKLSDVQRQTALRILSRYFKANAKPVDGSTQTDDNKIKEKYERRKDQIRQLQKEKEKFELQNYDLGKQVKNISEENGKIKHSMKVRDISLLDQEEKLKSLISQELAFRMKSEDLDKKLSEATYSLQKAVADKDYLTKKYQKKVEKMQKLEKEYVVLKESREEVERKMKIQLQQIQESYKVMSDAYLKERVAKETLVSRMSSSGLPVANQLQGISGSGQQSQQKTETESILDGLSKINDDSKLTHGLSQANHSSRAANNLTTSTHRAQPSITSNRKADMKVQVNQRNPVKGRADDQEKNEEELNFGKIVKSTIDNERDRRAQPEEQDQNRDNQALYQVNEVGRVTNARNSQHAENVKKSSDPGFLTQALNAAKELGTNTLIKDQKHEKARESRRHSMNGDNSSNQNSTVNLKVVLNKHNGEARRGSNDEKTVPNHKTLNNDMVDYLDAEEYQRMLIELGKSKQMSTGTRLGDREYFPKTSTKGVTQFDDMSQHLLHTDKCGPDCPHLTRDGLKSPQKGKRQLLPLKKQKLQIESEDF